MGMSDCIGAGCDLPSRHRGYCRKHYKHALKNGIIVKNDYGTAVCPVCYNSFAKTSPSKRYCSTHCAKIDGRVRLAYNMPEGEYGKMLIEQDHKCSICGGKDTRQRLSVDHDHATGKIRSLLCTPCNTALGLVNDSIERLDDLKRYLIKHKEDPVSENVGAYTTVWENFG